MRHPTQPEENMMAAVLRSVSEDACRHGMGSGCFHGFEFKAMRLGGRGRPGAMARLKIVVSQDGEVIESRLLDVLNDPL
jgi:hypothetical protein